jgi:KDO2-lipid IV(A) lauroyltransferase
VQLTAGADSTDVRLGGRWTGRQRRKNDALWALAWLALAATRLLPLAVLRALGRGLGAVAYRLAGRARATAAANVARVYPALDPLARRDLVRTSFVTLGDALGETVALLREEDRRPPPLPLSDDARAVLDAAREAGHGVVFASAHLGPWECVAASLVRAGIPLTTIARESYDPRFSRLYERLRAACGVGVIWRGSPGAATRIVRTLRAGGVLGVPMDLRSRVPCRASPFLGHEAPTPIGPARIALRTGAAVVVGTLAIRDGAGATFRGRGPETQTRPGRGPETQTRARGPETQTRAITATRIETADLDRAESRAADVLTARINAELSRRILALPHAWVWMHDRWAPERATEEYAGGLARA